MMPYKDREVKKAWNRKWYAKHSKEEYVRTQIWRKQNPVWVKEYQDKWALKRRYGLTPEEFGSMWQRQKGLCAICGKVLKRGTGGHAVDHNHKTGKVRGLLCAGCNKAVGVLEDSELKEKAESYLAQFLS